MYLACLRRDPARSTQLILCVLYTVLLQRLVVHRYPGWKIVELRHDNEGEWREANNMWSDLRVVSAAFVIFRRSIATNFWTTVDYLITHSTRPPPPGNALWDLFTCTKYCAPFFSVWMPRGHLTQWLKRLSVGIPPPSAVLSLHHSLCWT